MNTLLDTLNFFAALILLGFVLHWYAYWIVRGILRAKQQFTIRNDERNDLTATEAARGTLTNQD